MSVQYLSTYSMFSAQISSVLLYGRRQWEGHISKAPIHSWYTNGHLQETVA
jgi:hypothetical protein